VLSSTFLVKKGSLGSRITWFITNLNTFSTNKMVILDGNYKGSWQLEVIATSYNIFENGGKHSEQKLVKITILGNYIIIAMTGLFIAILNLQLNMTLSRRTRK